MYRLLLTVLIIIICPISSFASQTEQDSLSTPKHKGFKHFIQLLTDVDTNYVSLNKYKASAMLLGEKTFTFYSLKARNDEGREQKLTFSPYSPMRFGPYIGFSLLYLGYTFDVGAKRASSERSSIYLSLYSKLIGIDLFYETDADNYRLKSVSGFGQDNDNKIKNYSFSGMSTNFFNLHVYYLFNNRRFSYPAAYSQSTIQKRSSGSLILGFNYTNEKVKFDPMALPSELVYDQYGNEILNNNLKIGNVNYRNYSISIGYGYNWVFSKNWLANLTINPTLGYNFSKGERLNSPEQLFKLDVLNFDFISRASIVWNNSHIFAGFSAVGHTYTYKKPLFTVQNSLVTLSLYSGFYFVKDKKHK